MSTPQKYIWIGHQRDDDILVKYLCQCPQDIIDRIHHINIYKISEKLTAPLWFCLNHPSINDRVDYLSLISQGMFDKTAINPNDLKKQTVSLITDRVCTLNCKMRVCFGVVTNIKR